MTFEYTPPTHANDEASRALLEATTFKPKTKHADHCPKRELPTKWQPGRTPGNGYGETAMGSAHQCTCAENPVAKRLRKLRAMGVVRD